MNGTYLVHHGIKGQKWGIRRYQNPDGSLTEAGRKRYLKDISNKVTNNDSFNPSSERIVEINRAIVNSIPDDVKSNLNKIGKRLRDVENEYESINRGEVFYAKDSKEYKDLEKEAKEVIINNLDNWNLREEYEYAKKEGIDPWHMKHLSNELWYEMSESELGDKYQALYEKNHPEEIKKAYELIDEMMATESLYRGAVSTAAKALVGKYGSRPVKNSNARKSGETYQDVEHYVQDVLYGQMRN